MQGLGGSRDADAAHTKHVGEEFVRHMEIVGVGTVPVHQQPARQALPGARG